MNEKNINERKKQVKKQVCVSLTAPILLKIDDIAYKNGFGRAEVLRRAISEFISRQQGGR